MTKKKRRTRAPGSVAIPAQAVPVARPIRAPQPEPRAKEVDFRREYHYVLEDLKRIAVYAVALIALLILMAVIFAFIG
jgi:cell division protein FtsX